MNGSSENVFFKEAKGYNERTVDAAAKALNRFEVYTKFKDFKRFHINQAKAFKYHPPNIFPACYIMALNQAQGKCFLGSVPSIPSFSDILLLKP